MSEQAPSESLTGRMAAKARAWAVAVRERPAGAPSQRRDWIVAAGVAALLALGPVATIAGAKLLAGNARTETRQLADQLAPRIAASEAAARERAELVALLRRPGVGAVADALARTLPPEAALVRIERNRDGLLEVDVSAPDPDRIRAALRGEPVLAGLRNTGQRRGDATMTVSFREAAQ